MVKYFKKHQKNVLFLSFLFIGCTTSSKGNVHNNKEITQPKIITCPPPPKLSIDNIMSSCIENEEAKNKVQQLKLQENILLEINAVETLFLSEKCTEVLAHFNTLKNAVQNADSLVLPHLSQLAIGLCDARSNLKDVNKVQKAIFLLNSSLTALPHYNEIWVHSQLSDLYLALGNLNLALAEKKKVRELLIQIQKEISVLDEEIQQLSPNEILENKTVTGVQTQPVSSPQNIESILNSATKLINEDSPEEAIKLLDSITPEMKNSAVKRLRSDAVNSLVMNFRFKVRALFTRASSENPQAKKETLSQCEQILKRIIDSYPDYADILSVKNNLKQIQKELAKLER